MNKAAIKEAFNTPRVTHTLSEVPSGFKESLVMRADLEYSPDIFNSGEWVDHAVGLLGMDIEDLLVNGDTENRRDLFLAVQDGVKKLNAKSAKAVVTELWWDSAPHEVKGTVEVTVFFKIASRFYFD